MSVCPCLCYIGPDLTNRRYWCLILCRSSHSEIWYWRYSGLLFCSTRISQHIKKYISVLFLISSLFLKENLNSSNLTTPVALTVAINKEEHDISPLNGVLCFFLILSYERDERQPSTFMTLIWNLSSCDKVVYWRMGLSVHSLLSWIYVGELLILLLPVYYHTTA